MFVFCKYRCSDNSCQTLSIDSTCRYFRGEMMICEHIGAPIYFTPMKPEENIMFGKRLRSSRLGARLTQKQVQALVGIGQGSLSELENGLHASSTFTAKLAHIYGVNSYWLATGEGTPKGIDDPSLGAKLTKANMDNADNLNNNREPPVMDWPEIITKRSERVQMVSSEGVFRYLYEGDLMAGPGEEGIPSGSVIKIDPTKPPTVGKPAVANVANKAVIGKYQEVGDSLFLCPANKQYNAIEITPDQLIGPVISYERAF